MYFSPCLSTSIIPEAPKILLVDDNIKNLNVLQSSFKGKGYRIQVALDGEKALHLATKESPHLILLDVMMPGIDGFETCRQLKINAELRYVPIIFLTARNETKDMVEGFNSGGIDYLTKPFDLEEVYIRVKTHLELYFERQLRQKHEAQLHLVNEELRKTNLDVIERLARASEYRDDQTGLHVKRMSHFSRALGRACGLGSEDCEMLYYASSMHDLGKIGIPDNILLKPGKFNPSERKLMEAHAEIGAKILSGSSSKLLKMASLIALTHQEKWDGTGYPKGLKGEEIPLWSRIVAISDVFDALTMVRPYKNAWSAEDALVKIKNDAGKHFDPDLVNYFSGIYAEILMIKDKYKDSKNVIETIV